VSVSHAPQPCSPGTADTEPGDDQGAAALAELAPLLSGLVDPRQAHGIRHPIGAVLTIMVLAKLTEATNVQERPDRAGRDAQAVAEAGQLPVSPRPVYYPPRQNHAPAGQHD